MKGGPPAYEQAALPVAGEGWATLASGDGSAPLRLGSDSRVALARPRDGGRTHLPQGDRLTFLHIISGIAMMEGERLVAGDGVQIAGGPVPALDWQSDGQVLLFDMSR